MSKRKSTPAASAETTAATAATVTTAPVTTAKKLDKAPRLDPATAKALNVVLAVNAAVPVEVKAKASRPALSAEDKAKRAEERAKMFPTAAGQEAAKKEPKAVKVKPAKPAPMPFVVKVLPKGAPVHLIARNIRPSSGPALMAHTHAALSLLGMMTSALKAVPKASLLSMLDQTAVSYHIRENNMIEKDGAVSLTHAGLGKFTNRAIDGALANAFTDLFIEGKIAPVLKINASQVYKVGL